MRTIPRSDGADARGLADDSARKGDDPIRMVLVVREGCCGRPGDERGMEEPGRLLGIEAVEALKRVLQAAEEIHRARGSTLLDVRDPDGGALLRKRLRFDRPRASPGDPCDV